MALKKHQLLTLEVLDINHLGFGVAKPDGFVVFIGGTAPGDIVEARIIKVNTSFAVARVERLLTPSPHRSATPRCQNTACSACAYRQVDYAYEKQCKRTSVIQAFKKAGLAEIEIGELLCTEQQHHYRNKAQYPVARRADGGIAIGFYAPRSHRVCEAADCPLQPTRFHAILEDIRAFVQAHGILPYDELTDEGWLRHIYLRRGELTGQILLTLVVTDDRFPLADALVAALTGKHPDIVGILLNIQPKRTNVILGDTYCTLFGRDYMTDVLCGVTLTLSAPSFYQVNHDAAELLYRKARALTAPQGDELLLDLYCGAGSIGLSMADAVREVIGIEIIDSAVRCAEHNAAQSGIQNARFFTGDATDSRHLLADAERTLGHPIRPDIVVLDPPRKGCDEQLLKYLAELSPSRIVYISCNPETLARDVAILKPLGYRCGKVTPVDLFPMTGHVESICILQMDSSI